MMTVLYIVNTVLIDIQVQVHDGRHHNKSGSGERDRGPVHDDRYVHREHSPDRCPYEHRDSRTRDRYVQHARTPENRGSSCDRYVHHEHSTPYYEQHSSRHHSYVRRSPSPDNYSLLHYDSHGKDRQFESSDVPHVHHDDSPAYYQDYHSSQSCYKTSKGYLRRFPSPAEKRDSRTCDHYVHHEHSPNYYEDHRSRSYGSRNSPDDQSRYVKRSPATSTKMDPHSPPPHKKPPHEPRQPTKHSPNDCLIKHPSCQHYDHEHAQSPDGQNPTAVKENIKETVPEPKKVFEIFKKGY